MEALPYKSTDAVTNTLTLPASTGTLHDENSTLLSSKLSGALPAIDGSALTGISGGKVLQIVKFQTGAVATGTTVTPNDDTIPQITEGNEYMSLAITPTDATSILLISVVVMYTTSAPQHTAIALFKDAGANAIASMLQSPSAGALSQHAGIVHNQTAGDTAVQTFTVRIGCVDAGTTTFNGRGGTRFHGGVLASSITITEYTA